MKSDELFHYGILGMKWGIRKDRLKRTTKSGDTITLEEQPPSRLASFLAKYSKAASDNIDRTAIFNIKDPDGKKVGDITLYKESSDELNVVWVTTNSSVRGRGYGTAVMQAAVDVAKDTGAKRVTLEVPGSSPDARHIYEKLGFKEVESPDNDPDDVWGGLTNMRLDLDETKHGSLSHAELLPFTGGFTKKYMEYLAKRIDELDSDNELRHYGILGMKWGVRRSEAQLARARGKKSSDDDVSEDYKKAHSSKSVKSMSDAELRNRLNRLQMEQQYSKLNPTAVSKGRDVASKILKAGTTVATVTSTALTIYNNFDKIKKLVKG